jgi:geranylgeranyl transferase type-1 subunit beta
MTESYPRFMTILDFGLTSPTAGMAYCGIGALTFLSRTRNQKLKTNLLSPETKEHAALLRWLVLRQTAELDTEDDSDYEDNDEGEKESIAIKNSKYVADVKNINDRIPRLPDLMPVKKWDYDWAGFNGRQNKPADTCYCFWVNGTIAVRPIS